MATSSKASPPHAKTSYNLQLVSTGDGDENEGEDLEFIKTQAYLSRLTLVMTDTGGWSCNKVILALPTLAGKKHLVSGGDNIDILAEDEGNSLNELGSGEARSSAGRYSIVISLHLREMSEVCNQREG